ncbi:hypothetical protein [Vibrio coralliilyticus]|uniref:Uncharacterized protein n=1 Tax=Vibrio coralliilyticus TaxID=190893 RepID=A0AAP6ZUH9_9VIBR|nr:hypothetical protein [Vibrio coralliilyticus]NOI32253.1 hypothetical protein [Vibrio coralliilyticus]NOJ25337.1 hypothetical protein [Vibrio coralliilyticus]
MKFNYVLPLPYSDSGSQHSIVRFNNSVIGKDKVTRKTPMFISNPKNGSWTIRYAMGNSGNIKGLTRTVIALDYDAASELGISFKHPVELDVTKATLVQSMTWLMTSPDLNVRLNTRFAVLGAVLGLVSLFISL